MILTRIQIENYKQYTGSHDIAVPAQATIGVIGENGAGKTTLFEAIEWCLYSPRAIAASDVRPRSAAGPTTVQVHIESVDGSQRYIVERVLKRTPSATLYRVDESGEIEAVVQGPRQVTDYVAARLIGLSHTAFTATFFTRQKELHLFGDQTPGKRREEVGRLLGLETIRTAQRQFTQERSRAASDARAMTAQYDRESQGRDFAAELAAADAIITQSTSQLAASAEAMTTARAALEQADTALATAQERREADSGLAQRIGSLDQERTGLLERQVQVAADLNRIVERGKERDRLAPIAARIPELSAEIKAQDRERDRFQRANELERSLSEIERRRRDLNGNVRATVDGIDKSHAQSGWVWSADDMLNPVDGMRRLIGIIDATDVTAVKSYETALRAASAAAQQCADAESILRRYSSERDKIEREEQSLLADGEPAERLPKLDKQREELLAAQTTCLAQRTANEADRDATLALIGNLANRHFGDDCPTCGRPFSESDASIVLASLRQRAEGMAAITAELIAQAADIGRQIDDNSKQRQAVHVQMEKLEHVRLRIQKSQGFLDRQVESVENANTALAAALATAGLQSAPNANDIEVAEAAVRHANSLHNARHSLVSALNIFLNLHDEQVATIESRRSLGDVSFDPAAYQQLLGALQESDRAQVSITQIEHVLARAPELEAARDATAARLSVIDDSLAAARAERTVLGYDAAELVNAQAARQHALAAERSASDTWHRSGSDLRQAELRRESVAKEQERLAQLARDADAKHSEAGYLEMMAKEMTEFERFAAARKVPVLGEYTSALVRSITDGRYERVEFDQDFGIVVYDGEDSESSFAVDTFSGGERDAITLAARIALSQMIGRQAVHPPGFLVLDEVFGSLDSDRRAHLLDLLGSISATFDELRQVFIISHVDDVRTSPVLDELWRVEESEDGISQVLNLRPGADIDSI